MRISFPIALSKHTARAGVVAAALALVGVTGATGASAAVVHPDSNTFSCTNSNPEVCVGINYAGTVVQNMQIQANLSGFSSTDILYIFVGPNFSGHSSTFSGGPGWVWQDTVPVNQSYAHGSGFCAQVQVNGALSPWACVHLP